MSLGVGNGRRFAPNSNGGAGVAADQAVTSLGRSAFNHLVLLSAIDRSTAAGQAEASAIIGARAGELGFDHSTDPSHNRLVFIPASHDELSQIPALVLVAHLDTSEGTVAERNLIIVPAWAGSDLPNLTHLSARSHPSTSAFVGDDLVIGSGEAPFGLDCGNGCALLCSLAECLSSRPDLPHGPVVLVFRTGEESYDDAAVESVIRTLKERGVRFGYTVDGVTPFVLNSHNFEASKLELRVGGLDPLQSAPRFHGALRLTINGVVAHTISGKEEGHFNALSIFSRVVQLLEDKVGEGITPISFVSDPVHECKGVATFFLPHQGMWKNVLEALFSVRSRLPNDAITYSFEMLDGPKEGTSTGSAASALARFLSDFEGSNPGYPLLPHESEGAEGISYPYFARAEGDRINLTFRMRDFSPSALLEREQHVEKLARKAFGELLEHDRTFQYANCGAVLDQHPELVNWLTASAQRAGFEAKHEPMRGGLGFDPFIKAGIYMANISAGYYGAEGPREFTSIQMLGRHLKWLINLVQEYAEYPPVNG